MSLNMQMMKNTKLAQNKVKYVVLKTRLLGYQSAECLSTSSLDEDNNDNDNE
jgi:hypothetical protein